MLRPVKRKSFAQSAGCVVEVTPADNDEYTVRITRGQALKMIGNSDTGKTLVVTFPSTHQALKFDRSFKARELDYQLTPVPRQISSSCGLAARVRGVVLERLLAELVAAGTEYEEVYLFSPPWL